MYIQYMYRIFKAALFKAAKILKTEIGGRGVENGALNG